MKKQLILIAGIISLAVTTAWAAPTAQVFGGRTSVSLAPEFVEALVSLGVTPSAIRPGKLDLDKGLLKYPVSGGAIDLEDLRGEISHKGGLGLGVPGTQVDLYNFIISTTGDPVLTGIASVNGDLVDRIPLFDLDLSTASVEESKRGILRIRDVGVTLNMVAADTLNAVFGVDAFVEGFPIGTANVITRAIDFHNQRGQGRDDDDDDGEDYDDDDEDEDDDD